MKTIATKEFKVWKTVKVGNFVNIVHLLETLQSKRRIRVSYGDDRFLTDFHEAVIKGVCCEPHLVLETKTRIANLTRVSLVQLGLQSGGKIEEIHSRALASGLKKCTLEMPFQLILQSPRQSFQAWRVEYGKYAQLGRFLLGHNIVFGTDVCNKGLCGGWINQLINLRFTTQSHVGGYVEDVERDCDVIMTLDEVMVKASGALTKGLTFEPDTQFIYEIPSKQERQ